jgi:hypothetical protein
MRRNKKPGQIPGCVYRWVEGWGWGLFSKSPYNTLGFVWKKNDPPPGFAGIWKGGTAPPPRVGFAAPERWPAKQLTERPPALLKQAQAIASYFAVTDPALRLSDDRLSRQRLRDLAAHIHEQHRHSGSAFVDKENLTHEQHARAIQYAMVEGVELYRKGNLRWSIDSNVDEYGAPITNYTYNPNFDKFGGKWIPIPHGTDSAIAAAAGFEFEEVASVVEARRRKPLRQRKKVGRPPKGDHAKSDKERNREQRARNKVKAPAYPPGVERGDIGPSPLGTTAALPYSISVTD